MLIETRSAEIADIIIDTDAMSPTEVAAQLVAEVGKLTSTTAMSDYRPTA